jgi:hypothetical protein
MKIKICKNPPKTEKKSSKTHVRKPHKTRQKFSISLLKTLKNPYKPLKNLSTANSEPFTYKVNYHFLSNDFKLDHSMEKCIAYYSLIIAYSEFELFISLAVHFKVA